MFLKSIARTGTGRHALATVTRRQCLRRFARLETNTMTSSLGLSNHDTSTSTSTSTSARPSPVTRIPRAVAVYCGANPGTVAAFQHAATCQSLVLLSSHLISADSLTPHPPLFNFALLISAFISHSPGARTRV